MTCTQGKNFLRTCLLQCDPNANLDELIIYKYGSKKDPTHYQKDEIKTDVDFTNVSDTVHYVVKCFIHLEIYAAWPRELCQGNGKCIAYKRDLSDMASKQDLQYSKTTLGDGQEMYWFRGEEGTKRFIKENLLHTTN